MKIIQIFPGKIWGGAEQYILDLGRTLHAHGHEVIYLARHSSAIRKRLEGSVLFRALPFACALDVYSAICLSEILKETCADILHIHDTKFVPLALLAKSISHSDVKVIFTRHIARAGSTLPFFRIAFRRLHCMIFVSGLARKMWTDANPWMPEERIHILHNSIPPLERDTLHEPLRTKYHIPKETPLIIFTGRIRRSKGCAVLIQALGEISHLPFAVILIGACKPAGYDTELLRLAERCGIRDRVFFHGFSDHTRALIQEADIGVAPSIVREACPLSPMEFMQAGKCIIATDNGAQPEYITSGKTGLLVAPNDSNELAQALKTVLEQPQFRRELGDKAKLYFDRYLSYDRFISHLTQLYESV